MHSRHVQNVHGKTSVVLCVCGLLLVGTQFLDRFTDRTFVTFEVVLQYFFSAVQRI